ncbi:extracellular solute-binding protein [Helicobacter turcicus]|uniref:Extracellular solute-binding protein n=1 Tax=Helicobacter turcicus TaxID=2867412 RepID=A0ABS7JLW9_9HELI|nr:extracellular solute-binding protein [Helicobacter turcicus]MBX7490376.1 extracellular solute-binding protein [Helicobacter turcicus]MBX7545045.1 extracellular solute-binding protein [Helicobacter turcicus]
MRFVVSFFFVLLFFGMFVNAQTYSGFALSAQGEIKYRNFKHFDYVNPNAPKGGHIKQYALGSYDSFYNFLPKGVSVKGLGLLYDTLMVRSFDEPSSQYGLVARQVQRAKDNTFVIFHLDENAHFNDGKEITAFDVEFSFNTIAKGDNPSMVRYYADVKDVIVVDKYTVRFNFKNNKNRELALILGDLPILPKHYYQAVDFNANLLRIPLGSGPYVIESFDAGRSITYKRVEKYWARNHPTRIGHFNFDKITIDYYENDAIALEAFKTGKYDFREEINARNWTLGYNGIALKNQDIQKQEFLHFLPSGMQGFVFNIRKNFFSDRCVREAIGLAFDFEWSNKNLFYNQYTRTKSFFENSEYASVGIPLGAELELLEPFRRSLPQELFTQSFSLPQSKGNGDNRENLKKAQALLKEAGYSLKNGKLQKDGNPFVFELLFVSPEMERVVIPFQKNLQTLGIVMQLHRVDVAQYVKRLRSFDYDMIVGVFPQSLSPGNEQAFFWGSEVAEIKGSHNYVGVRNSVVDALISKIIQAKNHKELVISVRALDRVLLWEHYVIPHFHTKTFRVAFWNFLEHPKITPIYEVGFETWWVDSKKLEEIQKKYPNFRR